MNRLKIEARHEAQWVTISSDEYETMKATIEALSDPEIMEQLIKSEEDLKAGRTRSWNDFVNEARKAKKA
ncbi:MAG: hypothetical protein HYX24_03770 [Candidatus Aenigmarchaeota archaeon]|nr:hypothetical protein [Candidatus Aenigmarchaeota archaeon]